MLHTHAGGAGVEPCGDTGNRERLHHVWPRGRGDAAEEQRPLGRSAPALLWCQSGGAGAGRALLPPLAGRRSDGQTAVAPALSAMLLSPSVMRSGTPFLATTMLVAAAATRRSGHLESAHIRQMPF